MRRLRSRSLVGILTSLRFDASRLCDTVHACPVAAAPGQFDLQCPHAKEASVSVEMESSKHASLVERGSKLMFRGERLPNSIHSIGSTSQEDECLWDTRVKIHNLNLTPSSSLIEQGLTPIFS